MPSVLMRTCPGKGLGTAPRSLRPSTVSTLRALGADSLAGRWSALRGAPLGRDNPSLRASVRALGTDPVSSTQEQPGSVASSGPPQVLTLHLSDSTIKFPVEPSAALELKQATVRVFDLFKEKETWERPRRLDSVKLVMASSSGNALAGQGALEVSFLVNPNAYPTAFQAKVLFGVKDPGTGVEIATEVPLAKFKQDLDDYLKRASLSV